MATAARAHRAKTPPARAQATPRLAHEATVVQRVTVLAMLAGSVLLVSERSLFIFATAKATAVWVGAVVLLAAAGLKLVNGAKLDVPRLPLAVALGWFVVGLAVSVVVADSLAVALLGTYGRFSGAVTYVAYLLAFMVVVTFDTGWVRRLLWTVIGVGAVVSVYGLLLYAGLAGPTFEIEPGFVSTFGNVNFSSAWLGITLAPLAWAVLSAKSWAVRAGLLALAVLLVGGLLLTRSSQGVIAGAAGVAVVGLGWLRTRLPSLARYVTPAALGAGVLGVLFLVLGLASKGPLAVLGMERSFQLRRWYWDTALQIFSTSPVTGVGMDHYGAYYRQYRPLAAAVEVPLGTGNDAAHNVPLHMLANGGLLLGLGYVAVIGVTAGFLAVGMRRLEGARLLLLSGVGGAWLAYQVQALVSIDIPPLGLAHFLLAGAVVAASGVAAVRPVQLARPPDRRARRPRLLAAGGVALVLLVVGVWAATVPLRADLHAGQAKAQFRAQQWELSVTGFRRAVELAPWESVYHHELGVALGSLERGDEALRVLDEAARLDPTDISPVITSARLAVQLGRPEEAIRRYDRALALEPQHPDLKTEVGRYLRDTGNRHRARVLGREALAADPENAGARALLQSLRA